MTVLYNSSESEEVDTQRESGTVGWREREGEGGRGERQTDRQTETETDRQRHRQTDREGRRLRLRQKQRQTDRQTDRKTETVVLCCLVLVILAWSGTRLVLPFLMLNI